ncbi:N-acetylmuramoyl-L-alanine amidase [Nocardioides ochotonae]|uniref:N-acetylmuramoyl-L-alanine amidase n=1 Tax=Nocardioides ochotonae TaxID=2685869 RepID=UPI00140781DE|nr:N-acetylmuramoyl-L-alanine amidase [Nocardioides ochotonae]
MAYKYLPADLPKRLRAAGLTVVEVDGWRTRGRPASTGAHAPVGVLCHHTATGRSVSDTAVVALLKNGRSDLAGPLAHFGLSRNGTVYMIAAGRANHAGKAKASGSVSGGDGNALYVGIEAFNDGVGEPWPSAQYEAYVTLCAVLCLHVTGNSAKTVRGHRETSVTGKIDPTFDMAKFRDRVAARMGELRAPADTRPAVSLERVKRAAQTPAWRRALTGKRVLADRRRVRAALKAEGCATFAEWQRRLGYTGADADGIPGRASLTALGDRQGFRVVP